MIQRHHSACILFAILIIIIMIITINFAESRHDKFEFYFGKSYPNGMCHVIFAKMTKLYSPIVRVDKCFIQKAFGCLSFAF
jgi:hypothetical protein